MRKFKSMKINEEEFNKKFEEDLKEIKEKLHAEKLSDEFKANLQARLEEELNKPSDKKERKIHFPAVTKRLAAACACLIIFFSSCITFADDIENVILELFGNTDKIIENAIANGNYKKIDMEYVEDNGISIKIDYIVLEKNNLYVIFNAFSEENFDEIHVEDFDIRTENDLTLYSYNDKKISNVTVIYKEQNVTSNNAIITYKLTSDDVDLEILNSLSINCKKIFFIKDNNKIIKEGNWNININL